jgi:hypothetical protein
LNVTCLHVSDQTRQSAELSPERRVHHVHVAGIRVRTSVRHFLPLILFEPANAPQALSRNENAHSANDACDVPR